MIDGHIHIMSGDVDPSCRDRTLTERGLEGAVMISQPPPCFGQDDKMADADHRLDLLEKWTRDAEHVYGLYWIDPVSETAADEVDLALSRQVDGFKVICGHHYPSDPRALPVYQRIADAGKPILFHSGILWDGKPSGVYNRPVEFECLMEIAGLRFALAHISWPWVDECLAVYGKMLNAHGRRGRLSSEMFIDITPGTPPIYREEALTKLFHIGYDVENNVIFGSDARAGIGTNRHWESRIHQDRVIFAKLGLTDEQVEKINSGNLLRFLGKVEGDVRHDVPVPERSD